MTALGRPRDVVLVKWGGGLITDKTSPESLNTATLERLASELHTARSVSALPVILGHGSGSFGHWSASGSFLSAAEPLAGALSREQLMVSARTADAAARLHRAVIERILEAGTATYSWLPSTAIFDGGASAIATSDPPVQALIEALERGYLPVTMGDVLLSAERGAVIWSTETIFEAVAARLALTEWRVKRILWMGNTDGVLDAHGATIDQVSTDNLEDAAAAVSGSEGVDVTGGMRLRFETCRQFATCGIESWVLDGRTGGVLERALQGDRIGGTEFVAVR